MKSLSRLLFAFAFSTTAYAAIVPSDKAELGVSQNYISNGGAERGTAGFVKYFDGQTFTVTIAAPGVFTVSSAHGMSVGDQVILSSTGSMPTGLSTATVYYVSAVPSSTTFQLSATSGGSSITTSGSQSGTHTLRTYRPLRGGSGGTASHLTLASSATAPLQGNRSLTIANSGSTSALGEGVSYAFSIGSSDQGKILNVEFDYLVSSGTFQSGNSTQDSDLEVFVYDVTNATLMPLSSNKLLSNSSSLTDRFSASFQASTSSTSYRLIFHVPTTNTNTWTIKTDAIRVVRSNYVYGTPITDWVNAGGNTITATTTNPTKGTIVVDSLFWRRVGGNAEIRIEYKQSAAGSAGSGDYLFALPSGISIDSTRISAFYTTVIGNSTAPLPTSSVGFSHSASTASLVTGGVYPYDATHVRLGGIQCNAPAGSVCNGAMIAGGSNVTLGVATTSYTAVFSVPVLGWGSPVQMSDSADTRVVAMNASRITSDLVGSANTAYAFNQTNVDTHGAWNGSVYTVPVTGVYEVAAIFVAGNASAATFSLYKNGSVYLPLVYQNSNFPALLGGSVIVSANIGDTLDLRTTTATITMKIGSSISIKRLSGPSAIAANEVIYAKMHLSANAATSTTASIPFDVKDFDSHGALSIGTSAKFTAPRSGLYLITGTFVAATNGVTFAYYKNGTAYEYATGASSGEASESGAAITVQLNQGDTFDVRGNSAFNAAASSITTYRSHIEITSLK